MPSRPAQSLAAPRWASPSLAHVAWQRSLSLLGIEHICTRMCSCSALERCCHRAQSLAAPRWASPSLAHVAWQRSLSLLGIEHICTRMCSCSALERCCHRHNSTRTRKTLRAVIWLPLFFCVFIWPMIWNALAAWDLRLFAFKVS